MVELERIYELERSRIARISDGAGDYHCPVFGEGSLRPLAMLIGEAPGAEEARLSRPFVGKAGRQLDELLALAGLERSSLYLTNAVKYRPVRQNSARRANRTPAVSEISAGLECLMAELELIAPDVIVTLGNTPLRAVSRLCGMKELRIGGIHGRPIEISIGKRRAVLFAHYHPASVIYNPALRQELERDAVALGEYIAAGRNGAMG